MARYIEIQNEVIKKYRIDLCDGTKCKDGDWGRTHAHIKQRRVCKWIQANSIQSTFELFHEIGHIETTKSEMRRAEEEYYATVWAIERCKEYNLEVPEKIVEEYQDYVDMEIARGKRRGGSGYNEKTLSNLMGLLKSEPKRIPQKFYFCICYDTCLVSNNESDGYIRRQYESATNVEEALKKFRNCCLDSSSCYYRVLGVEVMSTSVERASNVSLNNEGLGAKNRIETRVEDRLGWRR